MNTQQATLLLNRLRRLQDTQVKGRPLLLPEGAISRLDLVERRLLEAIRRDETGSPIRDGYGSGRPGGGGEDAGSSTETAAIGRLEKPTADPLHENVQAATRYLDQAVQALGGLLSRLDAIDNLRSMSKKDPSGSCIICDRHVEGTSVDRLRRGMCHADFVAYARAGRPDLTEFRRARREQAA